MFIGPRKEESLIPDYTTSLYDPPLLRHIKSLINDRISLVKTAVFGPSSKDTYQLSLPHSRQIFHSSVCLPVGMAHFFMPAEENNSSFYCCDFKLLSDNVTFAVSSLKDITGTLHCTSCGKYSSPSTSGTLYFFYLPFIISEFK